MVRRSVVGRFAPVGGYSLAADAVAPDDDAGVGGGACHSHLSLYLDRCALEPKLVLLPENHTAGRILNLIH